MYSTYVIFWDKKSISCCLTFLISTYIYEYLNDYFSSFHKQKYVHRKKYVIPQRRRTYLLVLVLLLLRVRDVHDSTLDCFFIM